MHVTIQIYYGIAQMVECKIEYHALCSLISCQAVNFKGSTCMHMTIQIYYGITQMVECSARNCKHKIQS